METDFSVFPDDPVAPSDPYPSLQLGAQSSSSAQMSGVDGDSVPVWAGTCDPLGVGIATERFHGDLSSSPPAVFHTPLSTFDDESCLNQSGCKYVLSECCVCVCVCMCVCVCVCVHI